MEKEMEDIIVINGIEYVRKDLASELAGMPYCIVRTQSAGVFAGYIESRNGQEVVIRKARRLWYWEGAASLSQLAVDGISKPNNCKFPCEVDTIEVLQATEIIKATARAKESIAQVPVWTV